MSQATGQVKILIFLVKINFLPIFSNIFCDAWQVPILRYFEAWGLSRINCGGGWGNCRGGRGCGRNFLQSFVPIFHSSGHAMSKCINKQKLIKIYQNIPCGSRFMSSFTKIPQCEASSPFAYQWYFITISKNMGVYLGKLGRYINS